MPSAQRKWNKGTPLRASSSKRDAARYSHRQMAATPPTIAILAGGSGTRFWPAGRVSRPKQVLPLDGDDPRPLLQATLERVKPLSKSPALIVAPASLRSLLHKLLKGHPKDAFLWEPMPRNTAAAVALTARYAEEVAPKSPVLLVPADHHISPLSTYRAALRAMISRARSGKSIVTLGLKPDRPATGYGYLKLGPQIDKRAAGPIHRVDAYVEKPTAPRARAMLKGRKHLWNGGTFAFRPDVFLDETAAHLPNVAAPLEEAFAHFGKRTFTSALKKAYKAMPSISVDYGVMERAAEVEVVAADFAWDDLGSWDAVARHRKPDEDGNLIRGDVTSVDSKDCVVDVSDGHVALLGVKDLIVVRTKDTVLVAKRGAGESVRDVVERLKATGRDDLVR